MSSEIGVRFSCLLAISISSYELSVSVAHVLTGLFDFLFRCLNSLYILNSNSPVDAQLGKVASYSVGHLYTCVPVHYFLRTRVFLQKSWFGQLF